MIAEGSEVCAAGFEKSISKYAFRVILCSYIQALNGSCQFVKGKKSDLQVTLEDDSLLLDSVLSSSNLGRFSEQKEMHICWETASLLSNSRLKFFFSQVKSFLYLIMHFYSVFYVYSQPSDFYKQISCPLLVVC